MGIGFLGIGFQPKWERKDIPMMPKVVFLSPHFQVLELIEHISMVTVPVIKQSNFKMDKSPVFSQLVMILA
jgi:gamma-glutamylcysteine synthetase